LQNANIGTASKRTTTVTTDKINIRGQSIGQLVTGVCCQWRGSGSFDSDVLIETFVLRGKFSGKIATEQQAPNRYQQGEKKDYNNEKNR